MNFLLSIPGKLKILLDRLTTSRANKIDNLNTTISSRAPANTALSNNTWTDAKAGNINTTISSRAPASTALNTSQWTNARASLLDELSSGVLQAILGSTKVQTGFVSFGEQSGIGEDNTYVDVAVSQVSAIDKCLPIVIGTHTADQAGTSVDAYVNGYTARLTSTTNLRISCRIDDKGIFARWYLIEFSS